MKHNISNLKKVLQAVAIASCFYAAPSSAIIYSNGNFTMLDPTGGSVGGANDVEGDWDSTLNPAIDSINFNMTIESKNPTPFFGFNWSAHDIRVFGPGTWTFNSGCIPAELQAGTAPAACAITGTDLTMTVAAGQVGAHILFDWAASTDIDVVVVWDQADVWIDANGQDATPNNLTLTGLNDVGGTNPPVATTIWDLVSTDDDGDGINGVSMVDGPFVGFNANFNFNPVTRSSGIQFQPPGSSEAANVNSVDGVIGGGWWLLMAFPALIGMRRLAKK